MYRRYIKFFVNFFLWLGLLVAMAITSEVTFIDRTDFNETHPIPSSTFKEHKLLAAHKQSMLMATNMTGGALNNLFWESRGPNDVGGRVRTIMFDPNDAANGYKKVWAGSVSGGLWFTNDITDPNVPWIAVDNLMANLAVMTITHDPVNSNVFYMGTGEGIGNTQAVRGAGIFKSTDGGLNWQLLSSTSTDIRFGYIQKIVVTGQSTVLAATKSLPGMNGGIMRSTDGGLTWSQVVPGHGADLSISKDGDIYMSLGLFNTTISVQKSTDDGLTWTNITPGNMGSGRAVLSCSKISNGTIFISSGQSAGSIRKSIDGGNSWTFLTAPKYFQSDCITQFNNYAQFIAYYAMMINVSPVDDDLLLLGGFEPFRSIDGGTNWTQVANWLGECGQFMHADHHIAVFRPNHPSEVVFGTDGGVFYSEDMGNSTVAKPTIIRRNNGLIIAQFYDIELDPRAHKNYMLAGAQDNAVQKFTLPGMNPHQQIWTPDGYISKIDQLNPDIQIYGYNNTLYRRSLDGGDTHERLNLSVPSTANFYNPFTYDSGTKSGYIAGSTNKLNIVANLDTAPSTTVETLALGNSKITTIKVSPHTTDRIFLGTTKGTVFRIDNASNNPTLSEITGNLGIGASTAEISDIEIGSTDNRLLITCRNYDKPSVWETSNGGSSWVDREGNLPNMPVRAAIYHPFNQNSAIVATELGVWTADQLDVASPVWYQINSNGMANVRTGDLAYRPTDSLLAIATHGRGVFTSPYFKLGNTTEPKVTFFNLQIEDVSEHVTTPERGFEATPGTYFDYEFPVYITKAPNVLTVVDITVGGDVYQNSDYVLLTSQLSFPAGEIKSKSIKIRILDDNILENTESLSINLSIQNPGNTNVQLGPSSSLSFNILDNDITPGAEDPVLIYEEIWEGASAGYNFWDVEQGVYNQWMPSQICKSTSTSLIISNGSGCVYAGNGAGTDTKVYNDVSGTEYTGYSIAFDWALEGNQEDYGQVIVSTDNGANWIDLGNKLFGSIPIQRDSIALPGDINYEDFWFGFQFVENGDAVVNTASTFEIDNIRIYGVPAAKPANSLNTSSMAYLGPNDIVVFEDQSGSPLVKIENLTAHDYGVTTVTIDRSGYTGSGFWNQGNEYALADKSLMITPSVNNPSGSYFITYYMSEQELDGWLAFANNNSNTVVRTAGDLTLAKTGGSIANIIPATPNANGQTNFLGQSTTITNLNGNYLVRAYFDTGFSGFGVGAPGPAPNQSLPVVLLNFQGANYNGYNLIEWTTSSEINHDYFVLEASTDENIFNSISKITKPVINKEGKRVYQIKDYNPEMLTYYRLKQFDRDGAVEVFKTILVENNNLATVILFPNPANSSFKIVFDQDCSGRLDLYGMDGSLRMHITGVRSGQEIDVEELKLGMYAFSLTYCDARYSGRFYRN